MKDKTVKIVIRPITPVFTGDYRRKGNKLQPQSIIGSFRFWLDIYCKSIESDTGIDFKIYKDEKLNVKDLGDDLTCIINDNLTNVNENSFIREAFIRQGLSVSSYIFGCNGWKSLISVEDIKMIENNYNAMEGLKGKKLLNNNGGFEWANSSSGGKSQKGINAWYFPDEFISNDVEISFKIKDETILNNIFYPLLNFINEYGYLGGKNNLGFGRVKFGCCDEHDISQSRKFNFKPYLSDDLYKGKDISSLSIEKAVHNVNNQEEFKEIIYSKDERKVIKYLVSDDITIDNSNNNKSLNNMEDIIRKLIKLKSEYRVEHKKKCSDEHERHYIFGAIDKSDKSKSNGSKVLPWIYRNNGIYQYGFIGLTNLRYFNNKGKEEKQ